MCEYIWWNTWFYIIIIHKKKNLTCDCGLSSCQRCHTYGQGWRNRWLWHCWGSGWRGRGCRMARLNTNGQWVDDGYWHAVCVRRGWVDFDTVLWGDGGLSAMNPAAHERNVYKNVCILMRHLIWMHQNNKLTNSPFQGVTGVSIPLS